MKKVIWTLAIAAMSVILVTATVWAEDAKPAHTFIGAKKCSMCHKGEAKGAIAEKWMESKHSKAFATLAGEESAALMKKMNRTGSAQDDKECLSCHATNVTFKEEGVSCESCHGAGSDYSPMKVMKDHAASVAAGMVAKPIEGCVNCHNPNSPTYKKFVAEEMWKHIAHGKPAK